MFNKRSSSNNFDNIDLNNLKSYKPLNHLDDDDYNNYNNYNNNIQNNVQPSKISSKNDVPIIKEIMEMDPKFIAIMRNRTNGLGSIAKSYQSGRVDDSMIKAIESNDLGVINDCFRYCLIKKDLEKINLTIDIALKIFPNIIQMVNCKHDPYFKTGINTAWVILNYFSEQITI